MNLKVSHKILGLSLGSALMAGIVVTGISFYESHAALVSQAERKLEAVTSSRKDNLQNYLQSIDEDLALLGSSALTRDMLGAFDAAWRELPPVGSAEEQLQRLYIHANPNPTGQKEKLDAAGDASTYSAAHGRYHPWLRSFLQTRGYYDVFLINRTGDVVYTVFKELDFATNVRTGRWKDSDLGTVYARAMKESGTSHFADFRPYAPSNDVPAAFIAKAILSESGVPMGVLVFQMPIERINTIMKSATGMGETGEVYIVGADMMMRSDSRFSKESMILKQRVDTETARDALAGGKGVKLIQDYRNQPVYSAYMPMEFLGQRFAVLGEMDKAEVLAPLYSTLQKTLLFTALALAALAAAAVWFARGITVPLTALLQKIGLLEKGDKSFDVDYRNRGDELGDLARALESFRLAAIRQDEMAEAQQREQKAKEVRQIKVDELIRQFEAATSAAVATLASAATEMSHTAENMTQMISRTNSKTGEVSIASEQTMGNVQTVAAAAEEMTASVQEISNRISDSTRIVEEAVRRAESADEAATALTAASQNIGTIVATIEAIAEQINLLALNATIESARAGEAGKGFAVVASEVKTLANETTKATGQIASQVNSVKDVASKVVLALSEIKNSVSRINEYSTSISSAVEEQTAVTTEISSNMQTASRGVQNINENIGEVSGAVQGAESSTKEMLTAAQELSRQAEKLSGEVRTFLDGIRAA